MRGTLGTGAGGAHLGGGMTSGASHYASEKIFKKFLEFLGVKGLGDLDGPQEGLARAAGCRGGAPLVTVPDDS
jgi:hypothetical protein